MIVLFRESKSRTSSSRVWPKQKPHSALMANGKFVQKTCDCNAVYRKHLDGAAINITLRDTEWDMYQDQEIMAVSERPYRSIRVEFSRVPDEHIHLLRNPPTEPSCAPMLPVRERRSPTPPFKQTDVPTVCKPSSVATGAASADMKVKPKRWWETSKKRKVSAASGTPCLETFFRPLLAAQTSSSE